MRLQCTGAWLPHSRHATYCMCKQMCDLFCSPDLLNAACCTSLWFPLYHPGTNLVSHDSTATSRSDKPKKKKKNQIWKHIIKKCYKGNTTSFCPVLGRLRRQFVIIADNYLRKWYLPLWAKQTGLRFLHPVLSQSLQHCTSRCPFDLSDGLRSRPCIII